LRHRRWLRHNNELFARRAIDLRPRIANAALNVLSALRAGEFEFSHKFYRPQNVPVSDMTRDMVGLLDSFSEKLQV
jgi:hypothetical protein